MQVQFLLHQIGKQEPERWPKTRFQYIPYQHIEQSFLAIHVFNENGGKPAIRTGNWWEWINLQQHACKSCHSLMQRPLQIWDNKEHEKCVDPRDKYCFMHTCVHRSEQYITTRAAHHAQDVVDHIYGMRLVKLKFLGTLHEHICSAWTTKKGLLVVNRFCILQVCYSKACWDLWNRQLFLWLLYIIRHHLVYLRTWTYTIISKVTSTYFLETTPMPYFWLQVILIQPALASTLIVLRG